MNKIINTFLLTGDKFVSEQDLQHPGFTFQKIRKTGNIYIEMNQLKNYIKQRLKIPKEEKSMRDLKVVFGLKVQLK